MLYISDLTQRYQVDSMTNHLEELAALYQENPQYFSSIGQEVPTENLWEDLVAVPAGKSSEDKCFLGFWDGDKLVAVLELVIDYPDENIAYVGLFMMSASRQRTGEGSRIMEEVFAWLRNDGYTWVELAYAYGNEQSENFWRKNGFVGNGEIRQQGDYYVVGMHRQL